MKIIEPSVEIMLTGLETELITPEQFIEKVGRTCYKSEDKITEISAAKFVDNLIRRGHEAMIEHWSFIFRTDAATYADMLNDKDTLLHDLDMRGDKKITAQLKPFLRYTDQITDDGDERYIVSGNVRAWRDYVLACTEIFGYVPRYLYGLIRRNPILFLEYQDWVPGIIVNDILIPITANKLVGHHEHLIHHDVTIKFICDRGVSHEIVRHRTASFAQESTRYCNYSGDKYNASITIVEPEFVRKARAEGNQRIVDVCNNACIRSERDYMELLQLGCTPQEARFVLLTGLKTEVIMTGNLDCWGHFLGLRTARDAHPDIQVVAKMAQPVVADIWKQVL